MSERNSLANIGRQLALFPHTALKRPAVYREIAFQDTIQSASGTGTEREPEDVGSGGWGTSNVLNSDQYVN
jgi:hypothetical protein